MAQIKYNIIFLPLLGVYRARVCMRLLCGVPGNV